MLRVISVWTGKAGSPWYSTLHFAGDTSADAQVAVDAVDEMLDLWLSAQISPITVEIDPFVASVSPSSGDTVGGFVTEPAAPRTATLTGDMLPAASQILVSWRTGAYVGGREIRGKMYIPGIAAVQSDPTGRVDDAFKSTMQGLMQTFIDGPATLQVYSRKNAQVLTVSSAVVMKEFAVLRSRRD